MIKRLKAWFRFGANASLLDGKLERIRTESETVLADLRDREVQMEAALKQVRTAKKSIEKTNEALDAVREQLRTAEDITIPSLVAAHKVVMDRWEDESRILVMRSTVSEGSQS